MHRNLYSEKRMFEEAPKEQPWAPRAVAWLYVYRKSDPSKPFIQLSNLVAVPAIGHDLSAEAEDGTTVTGKVVGVEWKLRAKTNLLTVNVLIDG